jgi:hypothetical protein
MSLHRLAWHILGRRRRHLPAEELLARLRRAGL